MEGLESNTGQTHISTNSKGESFIGNKINPVPGNFRYIVLRVLFMLINLTFVD